LQLQLLGVLLSSRALLYVNVSPSASLQLYEPISLHQQITWFRQLPMIMMMMDGDACFQQPMPVAVWSLDRRRKFKLSRMELISE